MTVTTAPLTEIVLPETGLVAADAAGDSDLWTDSLTPSDAQAARMIWRGALFGSPVVYVILAVIVMIAAPAQPMLLVVVVVPSLLGGWYFGAVASLAMFELRHEAQEAAEHQAVNRPRTVRHLKVRPVG